MFDRTVEPDPRTCRATQPRNRYRMRDGHRREYAASRDRGSTSFPERCARGARRHRRLRRRLRTATSPRPASAATPTPPGGPSTPGYGTGLVTKRPRATGPEGNPFKVLTLTQERRGRGPEAGRRTGNGSQPGNPVRTHPACRKPRTTPPSTAPACQEKQRLLEQGAQQSGVHPARHRTQERRRARERGGAC